MPGRRKEAEPTRRWYRARSSGRVRIDGVLHAYTRGRTIVPEDHPLVIRYPQRFAPISLPGRRVVEVAPEPVVEEFVTETVAEAVTEIVEEDEA